MLLRRPLAVRLANYRYFQQEVEFRFAGQPGLYYLTGDNQLEPSLGANDVGKSTLWEALYWCCFGVSTRGLKPTELATWSNAKDMRVEIDFLEEGDIFTLRRTWNPNALQLRKGMKEDGLFHDVTEEEVAGYVCVTSTPFLYSVLIPQFGESFLDLGPTDKANLLSSVLDFDRWITLAEAASKRTTDLDRVIQTAEIRLGELRGRLEELQSVDLTEQIDQWDLEYSARVKSLSERFEKIDKEKKELTAIKTEAELKLKGIKTARHEITSQMVEQKNRASDLRHLAEQDRASLARHNANSINYYERRKYFVDHDQCVACNQVIDPNHKEEQLLALDNMIRASDDEAGKTKGHLEHLIANVEGCEREQGRLQGDSALLGEDVARLDAEIRLSQQRLVQIDAEIDDVHAEITKLEREENPFEKEDAERKSKARIVQRDLFRADYEIECNQKKQNAISYWGKGFRILRLQLISEALMQLEVETNNMLEQLGLHDWAIEFDVDSITKSGTVRRGFSVAVKSPYNRTPVPWEAWGGGVSQRLRLAAMMGMSNLILNHCGVEAGIEVWDEPSNFLSPDGLDDLISVLRQRAIRQGKQIWLVDHRTFDAGGFVGVVTVVKDVHGSSFH